VCEFERYLAFGGGGCATSVTLLITCDDLEAEDLHLVLSLEGGMRVRAFFCEEFKFAHKGFMIG
jgi:hypothetical protein